MSDSTFACCISWTSGCVEMLGMQYDGILLHYAIWNTTHLVFFTLSYGSPLFDYTEILEKPTGHRIKLPCFVKTIYVLFPHYNQDFGKVIYKNQLYATITIYWSTRSAQHVSGNLLLTFRSVRLRFLQHMVWCPIAVVGRGSESGNVALRVLYEGRLPETCWADLVDQ